mmetsp:Transcript_10286/g.27304  ORF Transcript_10286/g.27304 Transcript_10286/m.27304 type:complete len:203 (+) Transcript_10286:595-1203(+)
MFLEEVEDRARHVRLAVAARAGHERVLALDDDAVAGSPLIRVERRRVARVLARFQPLREGAARRRRLRGLVVVRAVLREARGRRRGRLLFLLLLEREHGLVAIVELDLRLLLDLGLDLLLGLALRNERRAARLRLRHRALRRARVGLHGERSRRLGLDDARRSEAALAVVVRVVVAVERVDVDDLGPRLLRRRDDDDVVVFE